MQTPHGRKGNRVQKMWENKKKRNKKDSKGLLTREKGWRLTPMHEDVREKKKK